MTQAEIVRLFRQIVLVYPTFRLPEDMAREQIELWHRHLKEMPFETALRILDEHVATERFPPTIADFRSRIEDLESARRQKEEAESYFSRLEEWKRRAAPPPAGARERIMSMLQARGEDS